LLSAIERLDYPAEKLDVIVMVEADEPATHAAITRRKHRLPITVVPAPPAGPRTKPKALNIALELARGSFVAIYDAEDRLESHQLRRALEAFRSAGDDLALRAGTALHRHRHDLACPLFYRRICRQDIPRTNGNNRPYTRKPT
jgi:cellulose synthase/poly-beta-1,6-N-acetylglucosamine synthase-like glycosyltransferase